MRQNYPPAKVWTRVEVAIEPEPELVHYPAPINLSLPAEWPVERRQVFVYSFMFRVRGAQKVAA